MSETTTKIVEKTDGQEYKMVDDEAIRNKESIYAGTVTKKEVQVDIDENSQIKVGTDREEER